jgi:enoyl-CoA hydratase/carnithine racemase
MSEATQVLVQRKEGPIAILELARPERMNALNRPLLQALTEAVEALAVDPEVRAVVLTGQGKAFCAGADLKERATMSPPEVRTFLRRIRALMDALEAMPKPVIAAVNGLALGGGTELALACDLRVVAEGARLGLTETSLAIIPGAGGTQRLPRLVGKGRAKELIFSARQVPAQEALAIGLAEELAPDGEALSQAVAMAGRIVAVAAPIALAQAKFAINQGLEVDLASGLALEAKAYEVTIPTEDRTEALAAFAEKRKPVFQGR